MIQKKLLILFSFLFGAALVFTVSASADSTKGFYRYPALYKDTLVFAAEGDLWTVNIKGGTGRRLTTHPGEETHPVISPDGKTLAFSATYEGPTELYIMPLSGGLPSRLTYESDASTAIGFTPKGELIYSTRAFSTIPNPQLVTIGDSCEFGQRSALLTHCAIRGARPVVIEDEVWIGFSALILAWRDRRHAECRWNGRGRHQGRAAQIDRGGKPGEGATFSDRRRGRGPGSQAAGFRSHR